MEIAADFSTTFASDEEARLYGRAAVSFMTMPALDVPVGHWVLVQEWAAAAKLVDSSLADPVKGALWAATVAPGRILAAVCAHFKIL